MKNFTIKDILDLVVSDTPEAECRIEKMFEWHYQRVVTITQWILGFAATLFISVLVAFFTSDSTIPPWLMILASIIAIATSTYGLYRLVELRSLHRQFVASLKLFAEYKKMRAFFVRYRNIVGE